MFAYVFPKVIAKHNAGGKNLVLSVSCALGYYTWNTIKSCF